jgi:hypothetical protein
MLSDEDKAKIRAEEERAAQADRAAAEEAARLEAAAQYREAVQSELRGSPRAPNSKRNPLWIGLLAVLAVIALGVYFLLPRAADGADDISGGIATSVLVARCADAVRNKLGDFAARFPPNDETRSQISASADGKRWDGWVEGVNGDKVDRLEFSCSYTPANDGLEVQIIKP